MEQSLWELALLKLMDFIYDSFSSFLRRRQINSLIINRGHHFEGCLLLQINFPKFVENLVPQDLMGTASLLGIKLQKLFQHLLELWGVLLELSL